MARKKYRPDWYRFYRQQRANAELRGIGFHLTPEQWWKIWQSSGHWRERGRHADQYCMARFGDLGDYVVGNVEITTTKANNVSGSTGRTHTLATIIKMKTIHKGVQYRPYKLTVAQARKAESMMKSGVNVNAVAAQFGVSDSTIYRAVQRLATP